MSKLSKRKIAIVTGSRAEYGLMYWLIKEIHDDADLELQLIITGMHLSPEFGLTYNEIEKDGFYIDAKVDMKLSCDNVKEIIQSMGRAISGFADAYEKLLPDIIVVLGDRYEILVAVQTAMMMKIPVAHIHGGEITEGVLDESIRHAITKMAHIHFPVTEVYRKRIIQMGENPKNVYNFGAPGLDYIRRTKLLNRTEIETALNFKLGKQSFLVTYHPVTIDRENPHRGLEVIFKVLDHYPKAKVIFTKSNADEGGLRICRLVDEYVEKHPERMCAFISLGIMKYLSLAKQVDVVIGNSSSGLIEIPWVGTPTVNMGDRQKGRLLASSVIGCDETEEAVTSAIDKALSSDFRRTLSDIRSPYGDGNASYKIKEFLKSCSLNVLNKTFFDIDFKWDMR